jgi:hypothetical protein
MRIQDYGQKKRGGEGLFKAEHESPLFQEENIGG